ncbi:MAG: hypothetical protein ACKVS9_07330 [Phycisphaerae bacterium]
MVEFNYEFIEALDREEIEEARRMPGDRKLALGGMLFDDMERRMLDGIRHQFPSADAIERRRILEERLNLNSALEAGD